MTVPPFHENKQSEETIHTALGDSGGRTRGRRVSMRGRGTPPPEALIRQMEKALDNLTSMKRKLLDSCERMRTKILEESQRIAEIINRER